MKKTQFDQIVIQRDLLTIKEVALYLGIPESTLYFWIETGQMPHYRLGRLVRIKKEDVDAWLQSKRKEVVEVGKKAKEMLKGISRGRIDIDRIVEKSIAETKCTTYNQTQRGTGQSRGLENRKEADDGIV
jgi:excisionase family DNA binding protein